MKKIIILGVIGMIFIVFLLMYLLVPFFKLKGDKELTLEVNSKYNEQGYLTNRKVLEVSNNVDTSKIGTYYVFYKYKDHKEIKEKINNDETNLFNDHICGVDICYEYLRSAITLG